MTVTVRFAPSPTGNIHIGNARTALFNWLFAKNHGGRFILRFDDTDRARSREEYAIGIAEDLAWLGIFPDRVEHQSKRIAKYEAAAGTLKAAGLLYPCYETADELERRRRQRRARKLPPVYGREALTLSADDRAKLEAEGRKPHWRFLLPNFASDPQRPERTEIFWDDLVRGPQTVDLASLSDPVLVREDGTFLYTFTSVVDDAEMAVTQIIRGDDHVTNTGVQIALFKALDSTPPAFGHHNLLTAASGEGLSKRSGALSLRGLREAGIEPMAVASLAVLVGTSESVAAVATMEELQQRFDLAHASRSAAKFDPAELGLLNRQLVHEMPFDAVRDRLAGFGIEGTRGRQFWEAVRPNLETVGEAGEWWRILADGPAEPVSLGEDDLEFVRYAFDHLPPEPWDGETWKRWTGALKVKFGRRGKELFLPLRLAITGRASGPDLAGLLPLLDREGMLARRP